jgi:hypothetical protein
MGRGPVRQPRSWSFRPYTPLVMGPGFQYDRESLKSRTQGKGKDMLHQAPLPSQGEVGPARGGNRSGRTRTPAGAGRRWLWICLGAGAFILHLLMGKDSRVVEGVYSRGIFVGLRWLWDFTLGRSPVPLLYLFLTAAVLRGAWMTVRSMTGKRPRTSSSPWEKIKTGSLIVAGWAGALTFFFYALWGFNYNRIGIEKQLRLEAAPLDLERIKSEAGWTARMLAETRGMIPGATREVLGPAVLSPGLEAAVRSCLSGVLAKAGYPVPGRARVRTLWPGGLMMRFSGTGIYLPWFGEGYIAGNLMPPEKPFVVAHEMVHAFGIADEGGANFLGFLACESSGDPAVRYSGLLSYWSYVFAELARGSRDEARELAKRLPEGVKADIRAARENWDRYRGPLRAAARVFYEGYLKTQGVREGMKSYDRFVSLVAAWRRQGRSEE